MDRRALIVGTIAGTIAQLAMVISGHYQPSIAALFAIGGMTISFAAGLHVGFRSRGTTLGADILGGLIAGGLCAFIGIVVSWLLGDVTAVILAFGTLSSAVTGALGGAVGRVIAARLRTSN